jgi:hypothetical protein
MCVRLSFHKHHINFDDAVVDITTTNIVLSTVINFFIVILPLLLVMLFPILGAAFLWSHNILFPSYTSYSSIGLVISPNFSKKAYENL